MLCLAVNTANSELSVALLQDGRVLGSFKTFETRDQGNLLLKNIEKILSENGLGYIDLGLLGVVTGPGSFTGIRIGIAAMHGISLAAKLPLIGISSFDLYADQRAGYVNIVALESWREELYLKVEGHAPVNQSPDVFIKTLSSQKYIISGDAASKLDISGAVTSDNRPDAAVAALLAVRKFESDGIPVIRPLPFYLREADVTLSDKYRKTDLT